MRRRVSRKALLLVGFWVAVLILAGVGIYTHQNTLGDARLIGLLSDPSSNLELRRQVELTIQVFIIGNVISFAVLSVVFTLMYREIEHRQHLEEQLRDANAHLEERVHERTTELRRLSTQLLHVQDEERRHIARELHDVTAQNLSAMMLNLERLRQSQHGPLVDEIVAMTEQCLREIRTLSYLLHPPLLDEAGLASALRWYVDGFAKRSGIAVDLQMAADGERLSADIEMTLFRVAQECLSNVHHHAHCTRATVRVTRAAQEVALEVTDNGTGMPAPRQEGVGIMGMRERLAHLDGRLEIDTGPRGTAVRAVIPLERNG